MNDPGLRRPEVDDVLDLRQPPRHAIPLVVASGEEIYGRKLRFAEARQRVDALYHPYHHALRRLVDETEANFGGCLLLDCHSMPSAASAAGGQDGADIVLGDCYGASCAPRIVEAA